MKTPVLRGAVALAVLLASAFPMRQSLAQGAGARAPQQQWWVYKTQGGVYTGINRPLWKLSDIKRLHAGQDNWQQQIVATTEQEASYNSAAPGTAFGRRMNPDTATLFVVMAGEMHFSVEGQPEVTATRGSIVNVLESTIFSYAAAGAQNSLWVEVHPSNYKTVYPAADAPPPPVSGSQIVKVAFNHTPGTYVAPNQLHRNFFAAVAACAPLGVHVNEDHHYASALAGFANPGDPDDKCPHGPGGPPAGAGLAPFNPKSTFGHMHAGMTEWWIIQCGHMDGRIENAGEFHAEEGDVMAAPASTWHQMSYEGPGLSERLAITAFPFNNMNNTAPAP